MYGAERAEPYGKKILTNANFARSGENGRVGMVGFMSYVLVVDDEPDGSEVVCRILERSGITARTVANGQEALRELLTETPDAVVLDMRMPEMDGISLLEILRSYLRWYHLPVVLMTAHGTKAQLDRAKEL